MVMTLSTIGHFGRFVHLPVRPSARYDLPCGDNQTSAGNPDPVRWTELRAFSARLSGVICAHLCTGVRDLVLTRIIWTLIGIKILARIAHVNSINAANAAYVEAMRDHQDRLRLSYGLVPYDTDHDCAKGAD